jgi:hypothetical protein
MADRGIRWLRLVLYLAGGLALALAAIVTGYGRGKLPGRKGAAPPDAQRGTQAKVPVGPIAKAMAAPEVKTEDGQPAFQRQRLRPMVRQPKDPPSWDNWDMNLE